jgi:TonB family protein
MVLTGIIDATGKVRQVRIVRPVGFGLDEKGIEAVQSWKFKPATRDGKPVAVEMGLEISFNPY